MWSKDIIFPCVCFNLSMTVCQVQQHVNVSARNPLCGYKENDGCEKRLIKFLSLTVFFLLLISLFNIIILVISCLKVCLCSQFSHWLKSPQSLDVICLSTSLLCLFPFCKFMMCISFPVSSQLDSIGWEPKLISSPVKGSDQRAILGVNSA